MIGRLKPPGIDGVLYFPVHGTAAGSAPPPVGGAGRFCNRWRVANDEFGGVFVYRAFGTVHDVAPVTTNPIDGARRVRGRAKQKRILSERQRDKEYLDQQTPKPVAKKTAPPVAEPKPAIDEPERAPIPVSLPALVETQLAAPAHAPVAAPRDLAAEVDFKMQYWSRFLMLVIDNLHKH